MATSNYIPPKSSIMLPRHASGCARKGACPFDPTIRLAADPEFIW
jgi:hypothetical protein